MISPLKPEKEKNQWHIPIKTLLRDPSIEKNRKWYYVHFILFWYIWVCCKFGRNAWWEKIENNNTEYAQAVGRHNTSSMLMFQCWFIVLVYHNILSFMIQIKKNLMLPRPYVRSYLGEKGRQFFTNHGSLHQPNQLKHLFLFQ